MNLSVVKNINNDFPWHSHELIMIFLGDFFLALDKDGDGSVGCKDFASRMAASGKLPAGVDIESAIATVMYLS